MVEKPFGHDLESARELAEEMHQYIDESQLFRIDHFLGKMGLARSSTCGSPTRCSSRSGTGTTSSGPDHDGRGLRGRGSRPLLRPGRRAARRGGQPPDAGRRRGRDGAARRPRPDDAQGRACARYSGRCRPPTPRTTCAASTTATSTSTASRRDSTTETYAALRLEIDNWRWAGVPFYIRTGKLLPVTQTELRLVFKRAPRLGFARRAPARSPTSWYEARPVDGRPAAGRRTAQRTRSQAGADHARHGVRRPGRRGPDALEVLLYAAMQRDSTRFTRQDGAHGFVLPSTVSVHSAPSHAPPSTPRTSSTNQRLSSKPTRVGPRRARTSRLAEGFGRALRAG